MNKNHSLFLELVQVSLGSRDKLSRLPNHEEWKDLFDTAQKQAVTSFLLPAIDRMINNGLKFPKPLIYTWIGIGQRTSVLNRIVNQRCQDVSKLFAGAGFRSCILKGQGNALLYDKPLSRAPGDIDIWIDADRNSIRRFVTERFAEAKDSDLHIDFPFFGDVPIEVHYRPTIAQSYKYNKRLQDYYDTLSDECFRNKVLIGENEFCVPVPELNVVMQMSHVMNHFFEEGIGLRQIVDLFYLLKKTDLDRPKMGNKLRDLGMGRFTSAIMWVLHHEFGLEEMNLIASPDKRRGKLLFEDIMEGGNFGRFDQRPERILYSKSPLLYKIIRNMKYLWLFPMESFVSPALGKICRMR